MKPAMFSILALTTVALAATAVLTGCSSQTTKVLADCAKASVHPFEIVLYCADAGQVAKKINWLNWGQDESKATAEIVTNTCDPTCSAGNFETTKATIKLTKPVTVGSDLLYSKITIEYQKAPKGHPNPESLDLVTKPLG